MNFTGEPAKTKKQAQKNAAMSAWSALKILSKSSFSSSSSPTPTEYAGNDEQEQVIVARYLGTLQPQDANNLGQRDRQLQCRPGPAVPYRGGRSFHSSEPQKWAYSRFWPEVPMLHISPQDMASWQLSHQLALSSAPSISSRPQIFPFCQSIPQPDYRPYLFAQEQEPVPNVPGIGSPLYFSNYAMPVPVRNDSGVTIGETEEKPQVEKELLNGEGDSDCGKSNLPSNVCMPSLIEVKGERKNVSSAPNTRILVHPESNEIEQGHRIPLKPMEAKFRPRGQNADVAKFRSTNPHILNYLQSKSMPQGIHKTGSPGAIRSSVPNSFAPPVMVRAASASPSGSLRPESSISPTPAPPTRIVSSKCSTRPWLQETKGMRGMAVAHTMAPAVHIRSVVPVCSAPPAKRSARPSQEVPYPDVERMRSEKQREDI
ncbi:hypothetical protein HS088_TW14G01088 [Tripterygium wilfordii]|nr:hypothetical protein HS088_TW14G01088 [Tripterygium wilfordii]